MSDADIAKQQLGSMCKSACASMLWGSAWRQKAPMFGNYFQFDSNLMNLNVNPNMCPALKHSSADFWVQYLKASLKGLSDIYLRLHSTWRSGPEDRFYWQWEKKHLLLFNTPLKTQHTAKGEKQSVNVAAWLNVWEKEWGRLTWQDIIWVYSSLKFIDEENTSFGGALFQYVLIHFWLFNFS